MPKNGIEKVMTVLQGIGSGNAGLATRHINPKKYLEHNPRSTGGVAGVTEYINRLSKEDHHLKVVRAFQDGPYVFTHEEGLILGESVFFDIFRFEDGLIVEHWVFSANGAPPNRSGHTQTDGPTESKPSENAENNKSIVREFTRPFTSLGITKRSRNTFPEIIASDTNLASAMESRTSNVTWKNWLSTEASTRSSSSSDRETSCL
jgi:predicted SnoaL-like aldol condensation-catalyzing enzyme